MKVQDYDPVVDQVVAVAEDPNGNAQMLQTTADGKLKVDVASTTVNVSGDLVADVNTLEQTLGAKDDAAATGDTGTFSLVAIFKRGLAHLTSILGRIPNNLSIIGDRLKVDTGTVPVTDNGGSLTVDGTVTANVTFPTTQPVSATALPLPTGAATETTLSTLNTKIPTLSATASRLLVDGSGVTQPVSGTVTATGPLTNTELRAAAVPISGTVTATVTFPTTQPVSATALPLPTGASTELTLGSLLTICTSFRDNQGLGSSTIATTDTDNWNSIQLLKRISRLLNPSRNVLEVTGTASATSNTELAANANRIYLFIQNLSSAAIHVSFGGTASTSTLRIDAGGSIVFEGNTTPTTAINIIRTTAGQNFYIAHA